MLFLIILIFEKKKKFICFISFHIKMYKDKFLQNFVASNNLIEDNHQFGLSKLIKEHTNTKRFDVKQKVFDIHYKEQSILIITTHYNPIK